MKKTLSIVLFVLLVFLAVACSPETHKHTWDEGKVTREASCTESGVRTYTCTVCNETRDESIAKKGHSHADDAKPTAYFENMEPTCASEGKGYYVCQDCGEVYLASVPKNYNNHVYWDGEKYAKLTKADIDYYTLSETAEIAATYFTPAQKAAYCNSCGKIFKGATEIVEDKSGKKEYKNVTGMWVYTDVAKGISYFYDIKEDDKGSLTAKKITMTVSNGAVTTTVASAVSASFDTDSVRTMTIDTNVTLTESEGKTVLKVSGLPVDITDPEKATLNIIKGHNHLYGTDTADSAKSTFIGNDQYFELEKFMGENLVTSGKHYVTCSKCGLKHYGVTHTSTSSTDSTCSACGYLDSKYATVTVAMVGDPAVANALTNAKKAASAAKTAGVFTDSSKEKDCADALLAAKTAVEETRLALEWIGETESDVYTKLTDLLSTADGKTTSDSLAVAYSSSYAKAYTDGTATGAKTKDFGNYNAVLKLAGQYLGSGDESTYTDEGSKDAASKLLKTWMDGKNKPNLDSFDVPVGTVLSLDSKAYIGTNGTRYTLAAGTGWVGDSSALETGKGIVLTGEGWTVTGNGKLTFAVSK